VVLWKPVCGFQGAVGAFCASTAPAITAAAADYPARMRGETLHTDVPGQESRVYRKPLGIITVISPWNSPINLTLRSLAPALALGNAVVIKPASDTPITGGPCTPRSSRRPAFRGAYSAS
jgi:acyl-CoA reductase-like NAD-dependent aldehyde dehydrogenase